MSLAVLENNPLFAGIDANDLRSLLVCLKAVRRKYTKGESIFRVGDKAAQVGVVIGGGARVLMEDVEGQRTILSHAGPGDLFGEAFSCAGMDALPVSVVAAEASEIMMIDYRKIVTTCSSSC
ncbi:MAG: cyclic nucleotide-binding domain-containing protein, partial [Deltaproteobacteria bacterium]|nr:cyclic nucleotide-binding domain-containing protein [Deltaproteobacteria bacterium]